MTRERPLRILLLALLSFVVGGYGIFVGTGMLARQLLFMVGSPHPAAQRTWLQDTGRDQPIDLAMFLDHQVPGRFFVELATHAQRWVGGLLLVAVAFGLLDMRPWAFWLGALGALVMVGWQVGYFCFQVLFVLPATQNFYVEQNYRIYYGSGSAGGHLAMGFVIFLLLEVGVFVLHGLLMLGVLASLAFRRAPEAEKTRKWRKVQQAPP